MYRQRRVVRPSAHETTRRVWEPLVVLGVGFLLVAQTLAPMAAIAATIQTDLFVYQNGDTVTVTGDGFGATETVDLFTTDPAATVVDHGAATTDSAGGFSFQFSLNAIVGGLYTVTATGETSGLSASTQFDPPSLSVNPPTSFAFPQTGVGISSAGHSFTVTNASGAQKANNVTVTSTNNVDFSITPTTLGDIDQGQSVPFTVTFKPQTFGSKSATITVAAGNNGPNPTATVSATTPNARSTQTTVACSPSSAPIGAASTCTATVMDNGSGGKTTPTGSVSWTASPTGQGSFSAPTCALSGSGASSTCAVNYTPTSPTGSRTITATYADHGDHSGSNGSATLTVTSTLTATSLSVAVASGPYGGTANLSATLTAGGSGVGGKSIAFTLNGNSVGPATTNGSGVATLSGATLASINVGTYSSGVGASFAGDSSYSSSSATNTLTVDTAPLTATVSGSQVYGGSPSFTAVYSGFVNGQNSSVVTGSLSCSTNANASSAVGGGYTISNCSGLSAANYTIGYSYGTLTVNPAGLTATVSGSQVYGGSPSYTAVYSGFVNGQNSSVVTGSLSCSTNANASSAVGGGYTISNCSGLSAANYTIGYSYGTLTVNPAGLTATVSGSQVYGGSPSYTAVYSGFVNGQNSSVVTGSLSCSTNANASSPVGGGYTTSSCSGLSAANYTIGYAYGTLTVTPAGLTATVSGSQVYGGSPSYTAVYSGFVNGQNSSVVTGSLSCSTNADASSPVGGGYTISGCSGLSSANYSITYVNGTLTVTPAGLTATADPKSKVYGAGNPSLTYTITGFVNGDLASVVSGTAICTTTATLSSGVGGYPISCTQGSLSATNYNFSFVGGTLTVGPATLTVTANDKNREYGDSDPSFDATITGFKNGQTLTTSGVTGTASCSSTATMTSPVADYSITCTIGDLSSDNYSFTFALGTLHVTQAVLVVTANDKTRQYGDANPGFDATITGFKNGEKLASSGVRGSPACFTSATPASPVHDGPYAIHCVTGSLAAHNYSFSFINGWLTVTPAPLVITADDKTKPYGAELPVLTVTYSGFVNGEDAGSLTTEPAIATSATVSSHVAGSPYSIGASGAVDTNYTFSYAAGTLSVTPVTLTITANNQTKAYGAALPALTVSYLGLVNGDTSATFSSAPNTAPAITTTAHADSHVAGNPYSITASRAADSDYTISYVAGTLTVTPVWLTITADDQTKAYGAALPALTASYAGFTNGDAAASLTAPPTLSTPATAASHVAGNPFLITATGAVDNDYTISYVDGTLTVTPVTLTITADSKVKAYGAALPALIASYSGFVNGDTPASLTTLPTLTANATSASHVADRPYSITVSGAFDTDYTISYVAGTLTVTPVGLTITADNKTKAYGAAPVLTASYSGFVNGEAPGSLTTLPTLSTTATASSHVSGSPYAITAAGAVDADYTISYVTGALTVTPVGLTITADSKNKAYGAALPALTASYAGLVNGDTPASMATAPMLTTTATAASHVAGNPYSITVSAAVDTDYTISYVPGTLTVTPAPLTITAQNKTMVLNAAALPVLTVSYNAFVNGDTPASLTAQPSISTNATTASPIGTYSITASAAVDSDYAITYAPGTLSVVFASSTTSCGGVVGRTVLQPVNPDSSSVFKAGSTVPIKFRVCDANGNPVGGAVSVVKVGIDGHADPIVYNTVSNVGPVDETVVSTTPDADFRWDASGQQFIFNLNTKNLKAGVHYFYRIDLIDGTSIYYDFGVK